MQSYTKKAQNQLGSFPVFNVVSSTTLALFVMGAFILLLIHTTKLTKIVREKFTLQVYLNKLVTENDLIRMNQIISQKTFILKKSNIPQFTFISKQEAAKNFIQETGENFLEILQENPLRDSYLIHIDPQYQDNEKLKTIKQELEAIDGVFEVVYLENLITAINKNVKKISLILIAFTFVFLLVVIILINNTIKLALYSQRFLIRSMNLVGATANFIKKPFIIRAIMIGLLAGILSDLILLSLLHYANLHIETLPSLQQPHKIFILLVCMPLLGIFLTTIGTYKAIDKYLYISLEHLH